MAIKIIEGNIEKNQYRIGIVAAKWNSFITDHLLKGALKVLKSNGYDDDRIIAVRCAGAYEIPIIAQTLLPKVDGIIAIGAVIKGETPHFKYICESVSRGILRLNLDYNKPITFGVLTTHTVEEAAERADSESEHGNKGSAAALALLENISLMEKVKKMQNINA